MTEALKYLQKRMCERNSHQLNMAVLMKIAELPDASAVDFLVSELLEKHHYLLDRIRLMSAISHSGDPRASDIIWEHTNHMFPPHPSIIELYATLRERRAIPTLVKILKTRDLYSGERIAAAIALGNIGDKRAIPALIKVLGEDRTFTGYEDVPYSKNISLATYALYALQKFDSAPAQSACKVWEKKHHERALARVQWLAGLIHTRMYVSWKHQRELSRLHHYAVDFISEISKASMRDFKQAINAVFETLRDNPEMIPASAHSKLADFIFEQYEATRFSIYSSIYARVLSQLEDPRIAPRALEWLEKYETGWRNRDALSIISRHKIAEAIPLIREMYLGERPYSEDKVYLLATLLKIGTPEAHHLVDELLLSADIELKSRILHAYTATYAGTDHATGLIDELIDSGSKATRRQAIKCLALGGQASYHILLSFLTGHPDLRNSALAGIADKPQTFALPIIASTVQFDNFNHMFRYALEATGTEAAYALLNAWDASL